MFSCQQCEKYLPVFLDQALAVKESLDVEEHLRTCSICMNRAEAERILRAFVRTNAATPPLPEDVKHRLVQQAIHGSQRLVWRLPRRTVVHLRDVAIGMAVAAAVLLMVLGPLALQSHVEDMTQQVVREASMAYRAYSGHQIPLEVVSADDALVTQWFNSRMGYRLPVPCVMDKATQLVGGRLCRLLDRRSAALKYQRNGVDILLFVFKDDQLSLPTDRMIRTKAGSFYIQHVAGRPVAVWQHGGITYSMVGDVDRDALLNVATTMNYR